MWSFSGQYDSKVFCSSENSIIHHKCLFVYKWQWVNFFLQFKKIITLESKTLFCVELVLYQLMVFETPGFISSKLGYSPKKKKEEKTNTQVQNCII